MLNSNLQESFQAGVNSIYNAVVGKGITPESKALADIISAIKNINTKPEFVYVVGPGKQSETKRLSAGKYILFYCTTCHSYTTRCPDVQVFKNNVNVLTQGTVVVNYSDVYQFSTKAGSTTYILTEDADIYLYITPGNYYPYGAAGLVRIE